jgi:hypothetical protein
MSFGANGPSPISYTASSAGYHSFGGGGGNGGASGAMTGRSSAAQGMPAVGASMVAYSQMPTINMNRSQQGEMASSEPIFAVLSSYGNSSNSSVLGGIYSYGNLTTNAHTGINYAVGGSTMGVAGKKNAMGFDAAWWKWFNSWVEDNGDAYATGDGYYIFDQYDLRAVYDAFLAEYWNSGMGVAPSFDEWLDWYMSYTDNEEGFGYGETKYFWQPVGSILPLVAMALLYVLVVALRRKQMAKV